MDRHATSGLRFGRSPVNGQNCPHAAKRSQGHTCWLHRGHATQLAGPPTNWRRNERRTLTTTEATVSATPFGGVEHCRWSIPGPDPNSPRIEGPPRSIFPPSQEQPQRGDICLPSRARIFVLTRSGAHKAIDSGCPWMRCSICCQRAPQCNVHCKLGSTEQWESCCKNFNGPVVMRCHNHVHVVKSCVAPYCRTHLSAHPGQRPLWCHCPGFESSGTSTRSSVPALSVKDDPAFTESLQDQSSEPCLNAVLMDRRSTPPKLLVPNENEVGLVLPEGVLRSAVLPAVRPLSSLSTMCCSRTDPRPQVVPLWPSDEPVLVQVRSVSEFFSATTQFFFNCELVGTLVATTGTLSSIMRRASAHDAQQVGAMSERFLDPSPPTASTSGWLPEECQQCHSQHPCIVCLRMFFGLGWRESATCGGSVDPHRRICHAACKSGTKGIASHSLVSSSNFLFTTSSTNHVEPTGVPKTFMLGF